MDENTAGLFGATRSDKREEEKSDDKEEGGLQEVQADNLPSELLQHIFKLLPLKGLLAAGQVK